jgi:hypothetical protein
MSFNFGKVLLPFLHFLLYAIFTDEFAEKPINKNNYS